MKLNTIKAEQITDEIRSDFNISRDIEIDRQELYQMWRNSVNVKHFVKLLKDYLEIKPVKKTYSELKTYYRNIAIDYQLSSADETISLNQIMKNNDFFFKVGKRYGLLKEFKENGIL